MTLRQLAERIRKRIEDNAARVDAGFPPKLGGSVGVAFRDAAIGTRDDCMAALADPLFAGITPALKTQPAGTGMIDWFGDLTASAPGFGDDPPATTDDVQDVADAFNTIVAGTPALIAFYT